MRVKKHLKIDFAQCIGSLAFVYLQLDQALRGDQGHRGIHLDPENQ